MRTRAQLNAWKEVTAQHRRESAAFAAAIAASRVPQVAPRPCPRVDASNAVSAASNGLVVAAPASLITPEKTTRKRKHSLSSPSASSSTSPPPCLPPPALSEPADMSPVERGAKRRPPSSPASTKATKALAIRRTLDYCTAPTTSANAPDATKPDAPTSPRAVLERMASGDDYAPLFVGRAEEQLQIERVFVSPVASSPRSPSAAAAALTRALFVIGPPGTGKSSCVAHVAALHSRADSQVVRLNCSTFASPSALLQAVSDQLAALGVSPPLPPLDHAQQLDAFLTSSLHRSSSEQHDCVLVLDEVDHLVRLPSAALKTKAQQLLAFFVRWAYLPNAALRVIGILNGVDMHAQIAAFLAQDPHPTSVVLFPSYSLDELTAILTAYVQTATADAIPVADVVEPRALELIARKVAARDGDARRAVGMLRQCARASLLPSLAGDDKAETMQVRLSVRDVLKCTTAAIATQLSVAKQIEQLPRAPKLLLYALTRLAPCETAAVTLRDACDELESLQATHASLAWLPKFRLEDAQQHIGSLECYALVKQTKTTSKAKRMWLATLTSTVAMEALAKAFQDDELLRQLPLQG